MSFLKGPFSAQRYTAHPRAFGEDDVAALAALSIHHTRAGEDGVQVGWGGGRHELDGVLECGKNLRGEFLHWAFRVTQDKPPASRVKAVYEIELAAIMAEDGLERPTADARRQAKEAAAAKLEEEGKDGRYLKHTTIPVVWDGATGQVWYGSTSHTHTDRFVTLFEQTFGVELVPVTAGSLAGESDLEPAFGEVPAWIEGDGCDWLGNEFALWVMWNGETKATLTTPAVWVCNRVVLACPYGMRGCDSFVQETPVRLPEVEAALQDGKLPREIGLVLHHGGEGSGNRTITLQPERWVVSGVKLPEPAEVVAEGEQADVQRLEQCRDLFDSLDELFREFVAVRVSGMWDETADRINQWTGRVPAGV